MNGYEDADELPTYRIISSEIKAFNPYRGWLPVSFEDIEMRKYLSTVPLNMSISEIEDFSNSKTV